MPTPRILVTEYARAIASPDIAYSRKGRPSKPALFYGKPTIYLLNIDGRHETVMVLQNASS